MKKFIPVLSFIFFMVLCFFQWCSIQFIDPDILLWGGKKHFFYQFLLIFTMLVLMICGIIYKVQISKRWIKGFLITQIVMLTYLVGNYIYITWFKTLTEEEILFNYSHLKEKQPPPESWVIISITASIVLVIFLLILKRKYQK